MSFYGTKTWTATRLSSFSRVEKRESANGISGAGQMRQSLTSPRANLISADLRDATLGGADLSRADLSDANLGGANLGPCQPAGMHFGGANLFGANLFGANLRDAILDSANLSEADLGDALCETTIFADVVLSEVRGLDSIEHQGPSTVGIDTLFLSKGDIPEGFLRGCGVPDALIVQQRALVGAMEPIQDSTRDCSKDTGLSHHAALALCRILVV